MFPIQGCCLLSIESFKSERFDLRLCGTGVSENKMTILFFLMQIIFLQIHRFLKAHVLCTDLMSTTMMSLHLYLIIVLFDANLKLPAVSSVYLDPSHFVNEHKIFTEQKMKTKRLTFFIVHFNFIQYSQAKWTESILRLSTV